MSAWWQVLSRFSLIVDSKWKFCNCFTHVHWIIHLNEKYTRYLLLTWCMLSCVLCCLHHFILSEPWVFTWQCCYNTCFLRAECVKLHPRWTIGLLKMKKKRFRGLFMSGVFFFTLQICGFLSNFLSVSSFQHQPLCAGDVTDHIYDGDEWTGPAVNYTETWTSQKD